MSARTRGSKSRIKQLLGMSKSKSWKRTNPSLFVEVPTSSRAGVMYSKRVRFDKAPTSRPSPISDMVKYLATFFGGLFR